MSLPKKSPFSRAEAEELSRRRFLKQAAAAGAVLSLPGALWAAPERVSPVRVRGRVEAEGSGLEGVSVTDGHTVARTNADGTFELHSSVQQPFVYLSVPAGYRVPRSEKRTARFFQPIEPNAENEMQARFELEPLEGSDERHAFLALADPQTEDEEEMRRLHEQTVPDVQEVARELSDRPVFGVACGDIMFDDLSLYPDYEQAVSEMGLPFFQVIGNHDLEFSGLTDEASARTYSDHFGPTYYSFDRGAVHYVVLDDVFWNHVEYFGYLDAVQLHWLEQDLEHVEEGRPVVVFQHIPALSTQYRRTEEGDQPPPTISITNREALYQLLEPYQAHLISGHTHESEHVFEGGVHEHILGTVCGAWWSGPICFDGTPKGYGVFEVDGEDIRWRYKSTGHDFGHQLRVYERGADPEVPEEIVANVWDWDPEWTVVWYEDGTRKGEMERRVGTDPLSEELHRGEEKPERRPWVDPVPTDHLFYARVSPEAEDVRVEATDRFGRTYTATPEAL